MDSTPAGHTVWKFILKCTTSGNVQNIKPVQICTGFIFCSFHICV